jgi:hypothetical protein
MTRTNEAWEGPHSIGCGSLRFTTSEKSFEKDITIH